MEEQRLKIADLPALFITFSVIFIIASLGLSYSSTKDLAEESTLIRITGIVKDFKTYVPREGGRLMELSMVSNDRWYKISQKDLTWKYPKLNNITAGDQISALVTDKCCASNLKVGLKQAR